MDIYLNLHKCHILHDIRLKTLPKANSAGSFIGIMHLSQTPGVEPNKYQLEISNIL